MKADADRKKDMLSALSPVPLVPEARVLATVVTHPSIVQAQRP